MTEFTETDQRTLREGIEALDWLRAVLEQRLASAGGDAGTLLALRDVTGLAGRLSTSEPREWREGWMCGILSLRDVGVLEDWEAEAPRIAHSREDPQPSASAPHPGGIRALRRFLERYLAGFALLLISLG